MGEAPEAIVLVQTRRGRGARSSCPTATRLAYLTQTTLSVDETDGDHRRRCGERFPDIEAPKKEDICYATHEPPGAVKALLARDRPAARDRVAQLAPTRTAWSRWRARRGVPAYLIDDETRDRRAWLEGVETVGITSGASAPEWLVDAACDWFAERGVVVEPFAMVDEDVTFRLPVELRRELAAGRGAARLARALDELAITRDGELRGAEELRRIARVEPDCARRESRESLHSCSMASRADAGTPRPEPDSSGR